VQATVWMHQHLFNAGSVALLISRLSF